MNNFVLVYHLPNDQRYSHHLYFHDIYAVRLAFHEVTKEGLEACVYGLNKEACLEIAKYNKDHPR